MQARFYLPQWGRFASPDPARDQHFEETQSWNIYSYVQNNPVMIVDPIGMFEWGAGYTGDSKDVVGRRAAFIGALDATRANLGKVSDVGDRALLQRSIDAYGSAGDNNGVTVGFQASISDAAAKAELTGFGVDPKNEMQVRAEVKVTFSDNSDMGIDLPHEGSHAGDMQTLGKSMNTTGNPTGDPNNLTNRETETKAYTVSAVAGEAAGRSKVQYAGGTVHDKDWKPSVAAKKNRADGVKKQVDTYKNKDKRLYEEKK